MFDLEFTPQSDEAIESMERNEREGRLLAEGPARWEVISSASKTSQAGNPMIHVKFKAWDCNGKSGFVDDFFMSGDSSFFIKKIKSFCEAAGIEDKYNTGKLKKEDIHPGLTGDMVLTRKSYKGEMQNSIREYTKNDKLKGDGNNNKDLDDELPF